jgi:ribosomal protein S9
MQKREVIQKILSIVEAQGSDIMNVTNGVGWLGQSSAVQQQVNEAIRSWVEFDDPQPLIGVVELMQTLSMLTQADAEALGRAITDIQGRTKRA